MTDPAREPIVRGKTMHAQVQVFNRDNNERRVIWQGWVDPNCESFEVILPGSPHFGKGIDDTEIDDPAAYDEEPSL